MRHIFDKAIKTSQKSVSKFKISAIGLNHKGEVIGQGFNSPRFNRYGGGIHAEMALLKRYGTKVKTIILCRTGKGGDILPIDVCSRCQKVLDKHDIKVIILKNEDDSKTNR